MCFHKSLAVTASELEARYTVNLPDSAHFEPVYHANAWQLPTWPILTHQEPERFQLMHWGMIPPWTKTGEDAADLRTRTINARSETIYEKPSFRSAAKAGKRCLIPVSGFYEWHTLKGKKFPFYITMTDQKITSVAGLWDEWADPETGELVRTYTLLTGEANPLLAAIHNTKERMPCLLTREAEQLWLNTELTETDALTLLAEQYPASHMRSYSIGKLITSRTESSDVPAVLEPADYSELSNNPALFS